MFIALIAYFNHLARWLLVCWLLVFTYNRMLPFSVPMLWFMTWAITPRGDNPGAHIALTNSFLYTIRCKAFRLSSPTCRGDNRCRFLQLRGRQARQHSHTQLPAHLWDGEPLETRVNCVTRKLPQSPKLPRKSAALPSEPQVLNNSAEAESSISLTHWELATRRTELGSTRGRMKSQLALLPIIYLAKEPTRNKWAVSFNDHEVPERLLGWLSDVCHFASEKCV